MLHALRPCFALLCLAAGLLAPQARADTTRVLLLEEVIARHADAQSRFSDVDGVPLHYKDEGRGPAVLLVHGTLGDLSDWDGWVAALAARHRVIRLDLPGFGLTGPLASGNYSIDRYLGLVDGLMDRLGEARFAIAGISYGGLVAFRYAATRTERVTALLLVNSAGIETGRAAAPAAGETPPRNITSDAVVTAEDVVQNLTHILPDPARLTPQLVQRKLALFNIRGRAEEGAAGRRLYERGDPLRVLGHVRAPTLVLWGGANQALGTATADAFAAALKNACSVQRAVVPGGSHLLIVDKPEASAEHALAFLGRLPTVCRLPAY